MSIYDNLVTGSFREQMLAAHARQQLRRDRKEIHSSFWLPEINRYAQLDVEPTNPEYLHALLNLRRGVANFVHIITGRPIPVSFSTDGKSYSMAGLSGVPNDKERIVIAGTLAPEAIDVTVGLALHEAAHLVKSKYDVNTPESIPLFEFLNVLLESKNQFFTGDIKKNMTRLNIPDVVAREFLRTILNVLEDRRIDEWMHSTAPGYQNYYDAMYAHYWNSDTISTQMKSPLVRIPSVDMYRFHIVNLMNPDADPTCLPGLDEIYKLINVDDIARFGRDSNWATYPSSAFPEVLFTGKPGSAKKRETGNIVYPYLQLPEMVRVALDIMNIVYTHAVSNDVKQEDVPEKEGWSQFKDLSKQQTDFLNGKIDKLEIPEHVEGHVKALEDAGSSMSQVEDETFTGPVRVIVYRKLTESLLATPKFTFGSSRRAPIMERVVEEGIQMGNVLAHRLRIMADVHPLEHIRQPSGKLDKHQLAGLGYGNVQVFKTTLIEQLDPVFVHLSVDSSQSMNGTKFENAIRLAVALAQAAKKIRPLDVVISLRASGTYPEVCIAYDSRTDTMEKVRALFPKLHADGSTPEGLAFAAIRQDIIKFQNHGKKFFVNLSDGYPMCNTKVLDGKEPIWMSYSGKVAFTHTARMIGDMKKAGIHILSYFITSPGLKTRYDTPEAEDGFAKMYGPAAARIDPTSIGAIATTLNKLFLMAS